MKIQGILFTVILLANNVIAQEVAEKKIKFELSGFVKSDVFLIPGKMWKL